MSEIDRRDLRSPLSSECGNTIIDRNVVSQLAGLAAGEVEGIHLGGSYSRAGGRFLGRASGPSRGISVEVGRVETALDLTMGIDYGRDIIKTTGEVRRRIVERVKDLTGLRVTELNVTISDIIIPEREEERGGGPLSGETPTTEDETTELESGDVPEERAASGEDETGQTERRVR